MGNSPTFSEDNSSNNNGNVVNGINFLSNGGYTNFITTPSFVLDKNGALDNTSSYIGIAPDRRLGMIILSNRGDQYVAKVGRRTLLRLGLPAEVAAKELEALEARDE